MFCSFFFFSSRRRHTRFDCDWSSDVCSSDLTRRWMISAGRVPPLGCTPINSYTAASTAPFLPPPYLRSEEHTSELQSQSNLVCRLLLETENSRSRAGPHTPSHGGPCLYCLHS